MQNKIISELPYDLVAWGEDQDRSEEAIHNNIDAWWNNLSEEFRELAFFSVVKRLYEAECVDALSYRKTLTEKFGFSDDCYYMGIICKYMDLHQCIITPEELRDLRSAYLREKENEKRLMESFRIKTQCDSCGYQSMDIYPEDKRMCPMNDCEGMMREWKNE